MKKIPFHAIYDAYACVRISIWLDGILISSRKYLIERNNVEKSLEIIGTERGDAFT